MEGLHYNPMEDNSYGTYESIEERRRKAGTKLKAIKQEYHRQQAVLYKADDEVRNQHDVVEALKREYAAFSYLVLGLTEEAPCAQVFVQGAQVLASAYPSTPYFRGEGERLVAGFQRSVQQQAELAASAQQDMVHTAELLRLALGKVPELEQQACKAKETLQKLKKELEEAEMTWKLLLHTRSWSRQRW